MSRRRPFLVIVAVATAVLAVAGSGTSSAAACRPTANDGFGPFGRGLPPVRSRTGTGHFLTGVVLSALDCRPLRGAQVQFWQSNRKGVYTRALSATVITDRGGRFHYQSPRPTGYEGREGHIHIRVTAKGHETLLTRVVPAKGARNTAIRLVLVPQLL
jgi:protocatechuate 3,4-dioxygenase beta subunit